MPANSTCDLIQRLKIKVTLDFRRGVHDIFAVLGRYAVQIGT
jgi:hypothetical protein